jgi:short-subunit dehydrogenase
MKKENVLITGASSGIGLELARQFAIHGHSLILTAPREDELRSIASQLSQSHSVEVSFIAKNLEDPNAPEQLYSEITNNQVSIDILVNNAGLGQWGKFWETSIEKDITMIRVNIEAVVRLTKLFLPWMIARGRGRILNTASIAAFEPGPLLAVYHATKAFVLSFSEAIATELQDTGITVTALCPGATDTDFFSKANMVNTRGFQKGHVMSPQEVAEQGYAAVMKGERVHVTGTLNKVLTFSHRLLPESTQAKFNENLYKEVDPEDRKRARGDIESKAA